MSRYKYEIRIAAKFESAHYLYDYFAPGENEPLHGHSYKAELFIGSNYLKNGISVDFVEIRKKFDEIITQMEHRCLNTLEPFRETNPTAENIAEYIFLNICDHLQRDAFVTKITVWEGPDNYASFFPAS
ncbi:MAG: 6-carboxytetrahydropterin synthase [Spirochaetia bacterium]|nr:6-carboxytetrahydropterin synthase [Spirochaetia bacterium]